MADEELPLPPLHDNAAPGCDLPLLRPVQGAGSVLQPQGPSGAELDRLPQKSGPHSTGDSTGRGLVQLELPLHHCLARAALVLVVLLIAGGLFMFTYKSTQFNVEGFALVLAASFIGGIRWTLTQMLLQKAELGLQNPIDTMFHLQPLMFLGLFPLFAVFEGLHLSTSEKIFRFQDTGLLLRVLGSLFLGGILAFGLGFSEFLLVSRTSSLTLSIAGIFKEVCTLLLAAHLLGDHITLVNWLGFALCLSGISLHVALKVLHSRGSSGSKPLKSLGSSPDMELLLRTSQQEDEDNEEE
ncbi:solute carrier family 35 member C2 isoform X5 [Heterocephalus glaber]|uniref:Solute carrier family 35 member C2 isoform X5 n=1 Tax=Heterocephalus glaber TaxID=10181 RepID=A0AAX6RBZ0_HETGA|nr:solute carrier family 35 member C2 isoform X5 [Heterocephalus glaber]